MFCIVTVVGVHVLYCDSCKLGKKLEITVLSYAWTYRMEAGCFYPYSPTLRTK
jgi:hypothetical protein